MIYIVCFVFLFVFAQLDFYLNRKNKEITVSHKGIFILFSSFLIFLSAFRYKTGGDWYNYIPVFENSLQLNTTSFEFGYYYLNTIYKFLFNNYYVMQACVSLFCGTIIFSFIYKKSKYPYLTLLLYFALFFFNLDTAQIRQHIAVAILLLGHSFLEEKKLFRYILVIVVAMMFHVTAVCGIVIYFLNNTFSKKIQYLVLFACIFFAFFGQTILLYIVKIFLSFSFLPDRLLSLLNTYSNMVYFTTQKAFSTGFGFMLKVLILFFCIYWKKKDDNPLWLNSLLCAFLIECFSRHFNILSRFSSFFLICGGGLFAYNILLYPPFFKKIKMLFPVYFFCLCVFFSLPFFSQWTNKRDNLPNIINLWVPYYSVFNPVDDLAREKLGIQYTNEVQ